jgi:fumarate reductase subunit C
MKNYPKYNLSALNYKMIAGFVLFLILGFVLMHLGSKHNNDFIALTVSPIVLLTAFAGIIYTIIKN